MADVNMRKALDVFDDVKAMFRKNNWTFDADEEKLVIKTGFKSDDLPINFRFRVHSRNELVLIVSELPIDINKSKREDIAMAVSYANFKMLDGSFDFDYKEGKIYFRLTSSYRNSLLNSELYEYMVNVSVGTIDDYNDKFNAINEGKMSLAKFEEAVDKK